VPFDVEPQQARLGRIEAALGDQGVESRQRDTNGLVGKLAGVQQVMLRADRLPQRELGASDPVGDRDVVRANARL
jgi:hypothetical protein